MEQYEKLREKKYMYAYDSKSEFSIEIKHNQKPNKPMKNVGTENLLTKSYNITQNHSHSQRMAEEKHKHDYNHHPATTRFHTVDKTGVDK